MAGSVNKVILVGNLGRDPEHRVTNSGVDVVNFSLATTERRRSADGAWGDDTTWHRVVVFERLAKQCRDHLAKGRLVYVEGRLQSRKYNDRDGVERTAVEVVARDVVFLGGRDGGRDSETTSGTSSGTPRSRSAPASAPPPERDGGDVPYTPEDDDIPF